MTVECFVIVVAVGLLFALCLSNNNRLNVPFGAAAAAVVVN